MKTKKYVKICKKKNKTDKIRSNPGIQQIILKINPFHTSIYFNKIE